MNKKPKYIGIDVGGSKILIQAFDAKLNVISFKKEITDVRHSKAGFLKQLYSLIDEFFVKSVKGIGIAVPGIVNKKGVLIHAPHIPTGKNLNLKSVLKKRYKTSVYVDNDINAFLVAEHSSTKLKKYKNVLAVMIGTGLGGAAIVDGNLISGKDGYAGEFGHIVIKAGNKLSTFEQNTSGYYIKKYPKLKKDLVMNLGLGLASLNHIFNPDVIVLGGMLYLSLLSKKKKQLEQIIKKHSLAKQSPKLVDASSKTAVPKGAVLLLMDK